MGLNFNVQNYTFDILWQLEIIHMDKMRFGGDVNCQFTKFLADGSHGPGLTGHARTAPAYPAKVWSAPFWVSTAFRWCHQRRHIRIPYF